MRYAATHVRIETELTNGYYKHGSTCDCGLRRDGYKRNCSGVEDAERTGLAQRKRDRIDSKLEKLCAQVNLRVEYGALTVRLVNSDGREIAIP